MMPGRRDAAVYCRIHRDKSSKMYPKYQLVVESGTQFLMSARKRKKSKSSNYVLSFDQEDTGRLSPNFAGKVRANFLGTEFVVYDQGQKPQKAGESLLDHATYPIAIINRYLYWWVTLQSTLSTVI